MYEQLLKTMLSNTYTFHTMRHRLALLKEFLETTVYAAEQSQSPEMNLDTFLQQYQDDPSAQAMREWGSEFFSAFTAETMYDLIAAISDALEKLPSVTVYVPILFNEQEIASIGEWFRTNIHEHTMLDVRVDPSVVGGCGFVWNGHYYDYSFAYFLNKHRDELVAYLDSYGKDQ